MTKLNEKERDGLADAQFAFEKQRKEPLENASHVRNAVARFNQVEGVTDEERDAAWKRIQAAARKYDVELQETSWREIGRKKTSGGQKSSRRPAITRVESGAKAAIRSTDSLKARSARPALPRPAAGRASRPRPCSGR